VRDRDVDQGEPAEREEHPAAELEAVGEAPLISATVMMANIIWNTMNTYDGMPSGARDLPLLADPAGARTEVLGEAPMKLLRPELLFVPNAKVNPYRAHSTEMSPIHEKLIIIMFSVPLDRLRPP
jgi:hypothetical protein